MGVLTDTRAQRDEVVSSNIGGTFDQGLAHIVDLVLVDAKTVATWVGVWAFVGRVFNDVFEVVDMVGVWFLEKAPDWKDKKKGELSMKGEMKKNKNCLIKQCTNGVSYSGPNWSLFKTFGCA